MGRKKLPLEQTKKYWYQYHDGINIAAKSRRLKDYKKYSNLTFDNPTKPKDKEYKINPNTRQFISDRLPFYKYQEAINEVIQEAEVVWNKLIYHDIPQHQFDAIIILSITYETRMLTMNYPLLIMLKTGNYKEIPKIIISSNETRRTYKNMISALDLFCGINMLT